MRQAAAEAISPASVRACEPKEQAMTNRPVNRGGTLSIQQGVSAPSSEVTDRGGELSRPSTKAWLSAAKGYSSTDEGVVEYERALEKSLAQVLYFFGSESQSIDDGIDHHLQALGAEEAYDPLTYSEVIALGFGIMQSRAGRAFSHAELLEFTFLRLAKPMATSVIYRTISKLKDRGLIDSAGFYQNENTRKQAEFFEVHQNGKDAFRLAILNNKKLRLSLRLAA